MTTHTDTTEPTTDQIAHDAEQTPPLASGLLPLKTALDYASTFCDVLTPDMSDDEKATALEAMPFDHRVIVTLAMEGHMLAQQSDPATMLAEMLGGMGAGNIDGNA